MNPFCQHDLVFNALVQMLRQYISLICTLIAPIAHAEGLCIVPVRGGEAKLPVELEQPYRIASSPRNIPGFDGVIVHAFNRHELYEFNGSSLTLVENDFPHVWGYAFEHGIHIGPNGDAFGFGYRPRVIFRLASGAEVWEPIETTRGYERAFFDEGAGDVYWRAPSSERLARINADGSSDSVDLPVYQGDLTISVRTIPEISGALSLTGPRAPTPSPSSSLWFQKFGGEWSNVSINLPQGQKLLDTLQGAEFQIGDEIIRVFPSGTHYAPLIFRVSGQSLEFVASLPAGEWRFHAPSNTWIGWVGKPVQSVPSSFAFWRETSEQIPPRFLALGPDEVEARPIPDLTSNSFRSGQSVFYDPKPIITIGKLPALLRTNQGIVAFDGERVSDEQLFRYEEIGDLPSFKTIGSLNIIQSELGVFVLHDDLSLHRVASFPVENPWLHEVSIVFVDAWQSYFVIDRRSGKVHVSKDMQIFTEIESDDLVGGFVVVLPDPASILMIGEGRLLAVTDDCAPK